MLVSVNLSVDFSSFYMKNIYEVCSSQPGTFFWDEIRRLRTQHGDETHTVAAVMNLIGANILMKAVHL